MDLGLDKRGGLVRHRVAIPLSDLNAEGATIKDFTITDASGGGAATFYVDEIRLVVSGP